jgi:hypothetical protein
MALWEITPEKSLGCIWSARTKSVVGVTVVWALQIHANQIGP